MIMKNQLLITKFVREEGKLIPYTKDRNHKVLCPVCGAVTFDDYYVCNICGWEFESVDFDYAKSPANCWKSYHRPQSPKMWRKRFLKKCSPEIKKAYRDLLRLTHNKYRLFDLEFIDYNPGLYRKFYSGDWWDFDTREFIDKYVCLNPDKERDDGH